ncbi:uncharacterized protein LOC125238594 isoform X3 [Leguminivora glycinivorella]|uniref:uncharacterized protein LOC125238594 isoform X3 n=1 Tax=Leguminivora glycinivorella TaxID=1035111 RepID=UPI00200CEAB2|nr:uncharacterized protein LOC125238594 isoform X3 [Leguminivora glycinivorella]
MSQLRSRRTNNEADRRRMQQHDAHQLQRQRERRNAMDRSRRLDAPVVLERAAFHYQPEIDYGADKSVTIGEMTSICRYCKAIKYIGEPDGLCCANGKVKLPQLLPPPEPLNSLVLGTNNDSRAETPKAISTISTVPRVPGDKTSDKAGAGDTPVNDSISRKRPRPEPPAPRDQCRFCGDFKKCSPVVQKPYLMGKTTTLTLNHLRAEVDFSVDSLPTTICSDCDTKLLEIFQFIKLVNTAQFSLVTVCPNNATGAASLDQNHSVFEHIEFDTQIVKTEVESDDSNESIGEDSITLSEMIYLRDTHKRKEVDSKHNKKVKRDKVKIQDTDEIDDVKSAVIDDYDGNSEDSELTQEDNSEDSDTGTEVKTCEFNFANIASDYDRKTNFCDVNNQNSSGEDSD